MPLEVGVAASGKSWLKALIIVVVIIVVLIVGVVAAGFFWWSRNGETLIAKGKAQVTEGQAAGRSTDNQGCVDKAVERYKAERGMMSAIGTSIFMQTCLQASRPTPGFCDEVPRQMEFTETGRWRLAQCGRYDLSGDKYCQQLFSPVQQFCEKRGGATTGDEQTDSN
jgi:hypothetical protein